MEQLTKDNLELKERMVDLERMIDPVILDKYDATKSKVSLYFCNIVKNTKCSAICYYMGWLSRLFCHQGLYL